MKYKITLFRNDIYKEIKLDEKSGPIQIGTNKECQVRFNRKYFSIDFNIVVGIKDGRWLITCCRDIYFLRKNGLKEYVLYPEAGDIVRICYGASGAELFSLEFSYDFSRKKYEYNAMIDISETNLFRIGGDQSCEICIQDNVLKQDYVIFKRSNKGGFLADISHCKYRIYVNGYQSDNVVTSIPNKTFVEIIGYSFYFDGNIIITENNPHVTTRLRNQEIVYQNNHFLYPKYIKNARQHYVVPANPINVLSPTKKADEQKKKILMTILPSLLSVLLVVFFRGGGSGGMSNLYMPLMMGMGALVSVITYFSEGKEGKEKERKRQDGYIEYIQDQEKKIEVIRDKERKVLLLKYTSLQEKIQFVNDFSSKLFEKKPEDEDFLEVRLGIGNMEAGCEVTFREEEQLEIDDPLMDYPRLVHDKYKYVNNVPITLKLKDANAIGYIGKRDRLYEVAKNLLLSICIEHFYQDLKIVFIMNEGDVANFEWIRWLQHVWNDQANIRNIIHDNDSSKAIIENLYSLLNSRKEGSSGGGSNKANFNSHYVVFVYRSEMIAGHPIEKFMKNASSMGVTFVFFEEHEELINESCTYKIYLKPNVNEGVIQNVKDAVDTRAFAYEQINTGLAESVALKLAPVYIDEISLESTLTKNITLYELLGIMSVEDIELSTRWAQSKIYETMAAPLGVASGDQVMCLDLHEKFHGPHGLVAGTTGSGKSEILQSYILSMATLFHPYEVGFIIIDFKGGGMVNQFKNLPHLNGAITNIDGREIDRSLKSIKAELQKRQRLFADANVNHIDDYIKEYKKGSVSIPLPHLILIVDEFAELKRDQPDFMKELISAARIGRSLGVHLILATQKPSGVVDDQIWSNSKFKLCLKVQDESDSKEVLKSPLAAEIREPGRAYLQVGNNEIFKLFQSAYSGALAKMDNMGKQKKFQINKVGLAGERSVIYKEKPSKNSDDSMTQLDAIVEYIHDYCEKQEIAKLPSICLESLKKVIEFNESEVSLDRGFDIGIYDDPENQYQGSTWLDISNKNTFILGSSQYGKTNLLQLFIREIAMKYTPKEANIYILDFGSMVLKNFEALNHVGGVVTSSEDEKLKNLFKLLLEEMAIRKEKLVAIGVSSFNAYCEAGMTDLPRIYVFVDNMTALKELYLENDDTFLAIIRDCISVGISVIMANSTCSGISFRYLSNFANKLGLYCNDSGDYNNIFDRVKLKPDEIPGRAVLEMDKRAIECQTYLAFNGEKEIERVTEIKEFIAKTNEKYKDMHARVIPFIPNVLTKDILWKNFGATPNKYKIPVGLTFADVTPYYLDFGTLGAFGIVGKEGKGHKNFISNLLNTLEMNKEECPSKVVIIDDVSRKFKDFASLDIVEKHSLDVNEAITTIESWYEILSDRYKAMLDEVEPEDNSLLVMIVQNNDVAKTIAGNMAIADKYKEMVTKFKAMNVCFIFSNYPNQSISYDAPEAIRMIKTEQHVICLDDLGGLKSFDVPYEAIRDNKKKLALGDAYYIRDGIVIKLKVVKG